MIINQDRKTVDIEARDVNYILPAYVKMYLFQTRNEDPEKIVFPMFRAVPHPLKPGVMVPIEYVPDDSPIAIEIKNDGAVVPESTPESEAKADKVEDNYNAMKKRIAELEATVAAGSIKPVTPLSPTRAAFAAQAIEPTVVVDNVQPSAERLAKAKQPNHPAPEGSQSDYGGSRDGRDFRRIAADLKPDKAINEDEEREDTELPGRAKGKKS